MSGENTTEPGKTFNEVKKECVDLAKLNALGKPSVRTNADSIDTRELIDGAVTADKLADDVLAQINADAVIGDGAITTIKIANGAVTKAKLNQDVLDCFVRRDTVLTTIGAFLKYKTTDGITEEVAATSLGKILHVVQVQIVLRTTITSGFITLPIGTVPAGRTSVMLESRLVDIRGDEQHSIRIRDTNSRIYDLDNGLTDGTLEGETSMVQTGTSFYDVSGSATIAYEVKQVIGTATENDFRVTIKVMGWL